MCLLLPRATGGNWRRLLSGGVHANHARQRLAVVTRTRVMWDMYHRFSLSFRYFSNIFLDQKF